MSRRPVLVDLCCGGGGAAGGYFNAGFDVVGVDIAPQPHYPFPFVQADALDVMQLPLRPDAIHASPPCQAFSRATRWRGAHRAAEHPDLVAPMRKALENLGIPYVIENVPGAPLRPDLVLCGEMFGLRVHRHRVFEFGCGAHAMRIPHQPHRLKGARDNCHIEDGYTRVVTGNLADLTDARDAMGMDWGDRRTVTQAVPPAYTEYIGRQLFQLLAVAA